MVICFREEVYYLNVQHINDVWAESNLVQQLEKTNRVQFQWDYFFSQYVENIRSDTHCEAMVTKLDIIRVPWLGVSFRVSESVQYEMFNTLTTFELREVQRLEWYYFYLLNICKILCRTHIAKLGDIAIHHTVSVSRSRPSCLGVGFRVTESLSMSRGRFPWLRVSSVSRGRPPPFSLSAQRPLLLRWVEGPESNGATRYTPRTTLETQSHTFTIRLNCIPRKTTARILPRAPQAHTPRRRCKRRRALFFLRPTQRDWNGAMR